MTKTFAIAAAAAAIFAVSTGASIADPCYGNGYTNYTPVQTYTYVQTYVAPKPVTYTNYYNGY